MAENFTQTLKRGDLAPSIGFSVTQDSDNLPPADWAGATARFFMFSTDSEGELVEVINAPAVVQLPVDSGIIRYDWLSGDTDVVGTFRCLFILTKSDTKPESYPDEGYAYVTIEDRG